MLRINRHFLLGGTLWACYEMINLIWWSKSLIYNIYKNIRVYTILHDAHVQIVFYFSIHLSTFCHILCAKEYGGVLNTHSISLSLKYSTYNMNKILLLHAIIFVCLNYYFKYNLDIFIKNHFNAVPNKLIRNNFVIFNYF